MSDVIIFGGESRKALAIELLGAALALDLDPTLVRTTSRGFRVPAEIAEAAGYGAGDDKDAPTPAPVVEPVPTSATPDLEIVDGVIQKVERPKDTDNKDAWIKFAKAHGATDETLTGDNGKIITKDAIIASYGDKE